MRADLSRERRRHVLQLMRRTGVLTDTHLTDKDRLIYVVGALVCDDVGRVNTTDLAEALRDPSIVQAARALLRKAGAH